MRYPSTVNVASIERTNKREGFSFQRNEPVFIKAIAQQSRLDTIKTTQMANGGKVSVSIDLPSALENELTTEASRLNLPLPDYILHVLSSRSSLQNPPRTGAELLDYWKNVGVIGSRSDIVDSQKHARELRHNAETRERI